MAVVSRLELNHPSLGAAGGASLHTSIESLYTKIGDALSSRWFALADFDQAETVDLDHNFSTDISNLRFDYFNFVGSEWVKVTASTTPAISDFSIIEKSGEEGTVLQITNDTGGNDLTFAVSIVFDPIYVADGDIKDIDVTGITDKQVISWDNATKKFVSTDDLQNKRLINLRYDQESLAAATTITPSKVVVRMTSGTQVDMIDPATSKVLVLVNAAGAAVTISNLTGATAANQIITGTGSSLVMNDETSLYLAYDETSTKWRIIGGSGSSGVSGIDYFKNGNINTLGDQFWSKSGGFSAISLNTTTQLEGSKSLEITNTTPGTGVLEGELNTVDLGYRGVILGETALIRIVGTGTYEHRLYDVTAAAAIPGTTHTISGIAGGILHRVNLGCSITNANTVVFQFRDTGSGVAADVITLDSFRLTPDGAVSTSLMGKDTAYIPAVSEGFDVLVSRLQYRVNGTCVDIFGDLTAGPGAVAGNLRIGMPSGFTPFFQNSTANCIVGVLERDVVSAVRSVRLTVVANHLDTLLDIGADASDSSTNPLGAAAAGSFVSPGARYTLWARIPCAELQNNYNPTLSEALFESATLIANSLLAGNLSTSSAAPTIIKYTTTVTEENGIHYNSSTGAITFDFTGKVDLKARFWAVAPSTSGASTILIGTGTGADNIAGGFAPNDSTNGCTPSVDTTVSVTPSTTLYVKGFSSVASTPTLDNAGYNILSVTKNASKTGIAVGLPFPNGTLRLDSGNGHGSTTNNKIRRFTNIRQQVGDAFTYADSATDGMSITANRDMIASFSYSDARGVGAANAGISLNSSELTTDISNIAADDRLIMNLIQTGTAAENCSVTIRLNAGDIIRAHTDGSPDTALPRVQFVAQEVYRIG